MHFRLRFLIAFTEMCPEAYDGRTPKTSFAYMIHLRIRIEIKLEAQTTHQRRFQFHTIE